MTQELISLEEINQLDKRALNLPIETFSLSRKNMLALLDTARAAHELQDKLWEAGKIIADRNFEQLMKQNVLAELAKARTEERERCAKTADEYARCVLACRLCAEQVAKAIRALKD
jgi:hypothetical protein